MSDSVTCIYICLLTNSYQGIHILLNNCPKLTHLSLTGVQAFLRDELLAFCRDAPSEFNDHQRDVFCVFSGNGVGRLRDFLNQQKVASEAAANAARESSANGSIVGDEHSDFDNLDDLGLALPPRQSTYMVVNSHGLPPGITTQGMAFAYATDWQPQIQGLSTTHGPLSQSAPASTGGALWAGAGSHAMLGLGSPTGGAGSAASAAAANHVTGMMGATILDEVDEGDEAFGEDSEIMND